MLDHSDAIRRCLRDFLDSTGRAGVAFNTKSNVIRDLGMASDEGLDFVLDLCAQFSFDFPEDFNPFVDDEKQRGRKISEVINVVNGFLAEREIHV